MHGFGDLLAWLADSAGLPSALADPAAPFGNAAGAAARLAEAIALREAIYRIFSAVAEDRPVPEADLAAVNAALTAAPARTRLGPAGDGYGWVAAGGDRSIPALLAPVLWSAADLLTRADRSRLRRCANDECLWLFVDRSKTGTRRWCDMSSCGNRAKAHRHYLKSKAE